MKLILLTLAVLTFSGCDDISFAYTNDDAVTTIVGEASNQGHFGMLLVAETIRSRGSLKGCYGLTASHNLYESQRTWLEASAAWQESAYTHFSRGATGWGSREDWRNLKFRSGKIITVVWKHQIFYKEVKNGNHQHA